MSGWGDDGGPHAAARGPRDGEVFHSFFRSRDKADPATLGAWKSASRVPRRGKDDGEAPAPAPPKPPAP